jgi:hypothetical protein
MVHTSTLAVITDGKCLTYGGLSLGETVCFRSLKFIADYFGSLSLSPKGNDSGTVFVGMIHVGSPSLQTILENSTNEFYTTSSGEGSSGFPISQRSSMGTPPPPIATIPWPEDALTSQTMMMVPLRTIAPRPDTELPPERWQASHEGEWERARAQQANAEHVATQQRGELTSKWAIIAAQPDEPHYHKPTLNVERVLMVDLATAWA